MKVQDDNDHTLGDLPSMARGKDLPEGTRIDRYQILGLIGKGGMGAVYKAYDPELDRSIAIKILTAVPYEGETASRPQARLMREAQALAKLSHPNVVSVHDVGTYAAGVYIAMEYVKGKTLREWFQEEQPTWKEILAVMLSAGQGLQAAHAEGIVHRDFKPDNVLVGDNHQVKVLDFGLARAAGTEEIAFGHNAPKSPEEISSGESLLSTPLTRAGAMVGTTVYMAPEHFLSHELDEQTDQFSFCVTLFEALYKERPFSAKTVEELEENVTSGQVRSPQDSNVPKWIRDIIHKGLSVSKNDRFSCMSELLVALDSDPSLIRAQRLKRQVLFLGFVLASLFFMFIGQFMFNRSDGLCSGAARKIEKIWNPTQKAQINNAFLKTGLVYSNNTSARVTERLDAYLGKWETEYTEICQATHIRKEQSEKMMDLKMVCLTRHLIKVSALIRLFLRADEKVVENAAQAVSSLAEFSTCSDPETLQTRIQPPKDEQTKHAVAKIHRALAEVHALYETGKYADGLALIQQLDNEVQKIDYDLIKAEVLLEMGKALEKTGKHKQAEQRLHLAAQTAASAGDGLLMLRAMILNVRVIGYRQARHQVGFSTARNASGVLRLIQASELLQAELQGNLGKVHTSRYQYPKALECGLKALAIKEKHLNPAHPAIALSLNNIGAIYLNQGKYDQALTYLGKALALHERILGSQHPDVAQSLNNIGGVLERKGQYPKALNHHYRALAIRKKTLGQQHPQVAMSLYNIGLNFAMQSQFDKAIKHWQEAHNIYHQSLGPHHPDVARTLYNLALAQEKQGADKRALQTLSQARNIYEKVFGPEHALVALSTKALGEIYLNQQRPKQARTAFERVAQICDKVPCKTISKGDVLFGLARALMAQGRDKKRAWQLSKQAQEIFRKEPKKYNPELAAVQQWQEKHKRP